MRRAEAVAVAPARHLRVVRSEERRSAVAEAAAARRTVGLLLAVTGFLTVGGIIMVLSASSVYACSTGSCFVFFERQSAYAAVGVLAFLVTARMRYQAWRRLAIPFLGAAVLLLLLVMHPAAGIEAQGSARWIAFGPVTIQPSELAKLASIVFVASLLSRPRRRPEDLSQIALPLFGGIGIVAGLVFLQPDLGTTIVLVGTVAALLFVAGVRLRLLVIGGATMGAVALATLKPYQWARITAFLHPQANKQDTAYQLYQSLIALGSGGWLGVGLGASRQKWMYVPNAHTDFIFSILGEELGLIGEIVVLAAFGALLFAGVRIAAKAPDAFGRLLASGIVAWFGIQIVVNLGAVTGLLPITGVPLPFLSYGGSSLVVSLAAVGILVNVARESARAARRARRATPRRSGS
ncbi:MAG: putative lipid II flippase FtsW [Actinomycetota bacterium]